MAINFPATPSTNQTYTFNGRTWTWNGVGWQATGSTGLTVYTKTTFTATAGQTSFSCTYTVGFVDVYLNGVKLTTSDYTATTGTTVVLSVAAALNDIVETIAWTISSSFNPSLGSASATSLAIGGATIGTNALAVTGTTQLNSALNYGGVTLSNSVTGTGNMVLSDSPTLTGTPIAPTASALTSTTQIATTAFVSAPNGASEVLLGTASVTNAAALSLTSIPSSGYYAWKLIVDSFLPITDSVLAYVRISTGSAFVSGGTSYGYVARGADQAGGSGISGSAGDNHILLGDTGATFKTTSNSSTEIMIFNPSDTTMPKNMVTATSYQNTSGGTFRTLSSAGFYIEHNTALDGVQILFSSGNITGNARIYGLRSA